MEISEKLGFAIQLHQRNVFQKALKIYQDILEEDPQNIHALHLIGLLLQQNGWQDQGAAYLKKALNISPQYVEAKHNERVLQNPIAGRYSLEESVIESEDQEIVESSKATVDDWRRQRMLEL
jgi:tetratricopeptide (TPR) repeat protein